MSKVNMISPAVPNVPWQDKPEGHTGAPVWRYSENPIIGRNPVKGVARIFNSAVMPYGDEFIGVFRGEQVNGIPYIYMGRSKDAIHWDFDKDKIQFVDEEGKPFMPIYAYDPRLVKVEDTYYIIWGPQGGAARPKPELPKAIPEDVQEIVRKWPAIVGNAENPMKMYLKNARLSLGGDNKLMVVLEDGLASDYFKGEAHEQNKQQLEALLSDFSGKEIEVTIQTVESDRQFEDNYVDLSKVINMEIDEEE